MMDRDEILRLIKYKLGASRQRGQETVFKDCPRCHNSRWNFEVNVNKLLVHCWVCGWGGNIQRLLNELEIEYSGKLPKAKEEEKRSETDDMKLPEGTIPISQSKHVDIIMRYLASRGINEEDVGYYEIRWWPTEGRLVFPFRDEVGNLTFWTARTIFRNVRPKYYHASSETSSRIIKYVGQKHNPDIFCYVVEGVFDGVRLNKEGKDVIILMGTNISSTVVEYLRMFTRKVALVLDADAHHKSIKYEQELARHLGKENVKVIYLPERDVADRGLDNSGEGLAGFVRARMK